MEYTKGKWIRYGQHIHLDVRLISSEIVTVLCPGWMPKVEAGANANLIAAAPDMYEALKEIRQEGTRCLDTAQQGRPVREIYDIDKVDRLARQALAKAEGK